MRRAVSVLSLFLALLLVACEQMPQWDPSDPGRGPGALVGNDGPVSDGNFAGGNDTLPVARAVAPPAGTDPPICDSDCATFCAGASLENPVNRGLCPSLWGVGLEPQPIVVAEACRRLYVDMLGRFPSDIEVAQTCTGRPWGDIVKELIASDEFVRIQQLQYADMLSYNTQAVSLERVYDMDGLVIKLARGHVSYDLFAQVVSAHPVVVRRFADHGDIAGEVFELFMGRPAFDFEKNDFGRLYSHWVQGYYDHLPLNLRLPDSALQFPCYDGDTTPCSTTMFGGHTLVLEPDWRAGGEEYGDGDVMWSGMLSAEEWHMLQLPGRVLTSQPIFWETAVDSILQQYLGYDLGTIAPEVRDNLISYVLQYNGDVRALHYAVATSVAYLQSSEGLTPTGHRWSYGPRKQVNAEVWIDSINRFAEVSMTSDCDHRLNRPQDILESGSLSGYRLLSFSDWQISPEGEIDMEYASLARTLGGCPDNSNGGRFRVVSILTTATQLNYVNRLCDPSLAAENALPTSSQVLLPDGITAGVATDGTNAQQIFSHLSRLFMGRDANAAELATADAGGTACAGVGCNAEQFARAACFAILSSSEMLFY